MQALEKILRPHILRDQQLWYDKWLEEIQEAGHAHDYGAVYHKLQRLGRRKKNPNSIGPRPLPLVQAEDGRQAQDFGEAQSIWCEQFAKLEAGMAIEHDQLVKFHLAGPELQQDHIELDLLPTIPDLMTIAKKTKNGKATGPNGLPAEIFKIGGAEIMLHLMPLISKAVLYGREPLEWKGGTLVPLYKHKGHPNHASSYRNIFLSDSSAKIYHSWLRKQLQPQWEGSHTAIQHGGKRGFGTDTLHHLLHSHMVWSRANNKSLGLLFLDLRSAFYAVFRGSIFEGATDDRMLILALQHHNVLPEEWHEYRAQIEADHATSSLGPHAALLLEDVFHGTHFRMPTIQDPILTTRGTRPGDPIGDIAFNLIFNLIIRQVRQQVLDQLPLEWIGDPQPAANLLSQRPVPAQAYMDMAFVDDAVFAIHTAHAQPLVPYLQVLTSFLFDAARLRGLEVNCDQGKTELLVMHAGPGSRAAKAQLWHENGATIQVVTDTKCINIRAVHEYKHLGTWVQDKATVTREVRQRITAARQAEGRLHRNLFCKRQIGQATKRTLFKTLVMSKHYYNTHVWARATEKDMAKWEDGMRSPIAVLCKGRLRGVPPYRLHTKDLFGLAEVLPPSDQIHAARLKYTKRILHRAPRILWDLLRDTTDPQSWLPALIESFRWLRTHCPGRQLPVCEDINSLLEFVAIDDRFPTRVKAAEHACLAYREQEARAHVWELSVDITLTKYDIPAHDPVQQPVPWTCLQCSKNFANKRALAMHSASVHGYRKKAKFWVLNDECLSCGKKFYTRHRALMHVQAVPTCWSNLQACFPPITDEQVEELDSVDRQVALELKQKGWLPTKAFAPPMRLQCPTLPAAGTQDAADMYAKWASRTSMAARGYEWLQAIQAPSPVDEVTLDECPVPAFLGQTAGGAHKGALGIFANHGLTGLCAQISNKTRLFLHLFSGHRRLGDLHAHLEELQVGDGPIHCISLDICLMKENMDLTCKDALHFWRGKISDGWICGLGGGPPCETFSAARLEPGGPPPLRSEQHPWGLPNLTQKQWKQCSLGTHLVIAILDLVLFAAQYGLCGFLEHPGYPVWQARKCPASIWTWRVMKRLSRLECFRILTFDQCVLGAEGRKPTTLLLLRLGGLVPLIRAHGASGRCNHQGHRALIGTDETGQFNTARAKIYPVGMNSVLAESIAQFIQQGGFTTNAPLPADLDSLRCTDFVPRNVVQPDYQDQC